MALVYDLDVYKKSYDLLVKTFEVVKNFRREYKYTLGDKIKNEVLEVMLNVYRANVSVQKSIHIQRSREHIEMLKILFRLSKDLRLINVGQYTQLFSFTEEISKQLVSWQKCEEKRV